LLLPADNGCASLFQPMNPSLPVISAVVLLLTLPHLHAGATPSTPPAGKSGYHLFNPTPPAQLRDLSTDRPDQTESPYTVDAGHFQVELDFFKLTSDRHSTDGVRSETWNVAPINLKIGLLNNVDLQLVFDSYVSTRTRNPSTRASGFGDLTTRLKINLWGNDGGKTAFALMPYVKLPLDASELRNGHTEGGLIVPFAMELPGGWNLGLMTEVDWVSDDAGAHDTEWLNTVTLSRTLIGKLGAYVEFVAVAGDAPGFAWRGQVDAGFTYALTDNFAGCNFGVTRSAPDYEPFAGFSIRF
jgi:Putative MetA-pathway of phenol degradation